MDWKRVEEIEARVSAATEGPWLWDVPRRDGRYGEVGALRSMLPATVCEFGEENCSDDCREGTLPSKEDRDFMAHARSDVPWLIERLREMQRERDALALRVNRLENAAGEVQDRLVTVVEGFGQSSDPVMWMRDTCTRSQILAVAVDLNHALSIDRLPSEEKPADG